MAEHASTRLPDFVIIGAMKAGTTSLFQWLGEHPGCELPRIKEPHFFSLDSEYAKGLATYFEYFTGIDVDRVTGEASASYANPDLSDTVAQRLHSAAPDAQLIYLVRHPEQRLKSHYLHQWRRSREQRPLDDALRDPGNPYLALSRYADALEPFVRRYGAGSVLLIRLSDLASAHSPGWRQVTEFLGLPALPGTEDRINETSGKVVFSPLVLRLWQTGWLQRARCLPPPLRRAGNAVLRRSSPELEGRQAAVRDLVLPSAMRAELAEQWEAVHALVGQQAPPLEWVGKQGST